MHVPQDAADQILGRPPDQIRRDAIDVAVPPFAIERDKALGDRFEHGRLTPMHRGDRFLRPHLADVEPGAVDRLRTLMRQRAKECAFLSAWNRG